MTEGESKIIATLQTIMESVDRLSQRMTAMERRMEGEKRVSFERRDGSAAVQEVTASGGQGEEWKDGAEFFSRTSNATNGSSTSMFSPQDAGTKLERPKFGVKNSRTSEGVKTETLQDSDYLDFFDEYIHYMETWETLPINEGATYPNKERVAILNIPQKYARMLSDRLKLVFATSELQFMSVAQAKKAIFWKDQTTEQIRTRIGKKLEEEVSTLGTLDLLRRIKYNSKFGLIDSVAFAEFQHSFKKEVMRLQSGGSLTINKIQLKDIIIEALPDHAYQKELMAKFGGTGSLLVDDEEFAINTIFEQIEERITSITKQGLRAVVNKSIRERESNQFAPKPQNAAGRPRAAQLVEIEAEIQDQVNAALVGERECRNKGVGSDKLLKCRFLGGEKATCTFAHSASDLILKGKGVSKDVASPQWLNTGKKLFQATVESEEECEENENFGGGDEVVDEE